MEIFYYPESAAPLSENALNSIVRHIEEMQITSSGYYADRRGAYVIKNPYEMHEQLRIEGIKDDIALNITGSLPENTGLIHTSFVQGAECWLIVAQVRRRGHHTPERIHLIKTV